MVYMHYQRHTCKMERKSSASLRFYTAISTKVSPPVSCTPACLVVLIYMRPDRADLYYCIVIRLVLVARIRAPARGETERPVATVRNSICVPWFPAIVVPTIQGMHSCRAYGCAWVTQLHSDVVMRRVYGALLVAMLVVCCVCAESGRV